MPKQIQTILGIDPGYADVGYGIIQTDGNNLTAVDYGNITTSKHKTLPERLSEIHNEISKLIRMYAPNIIAVEELFFYKNAKTVIHVGQARGVILLTAIQANIPIKEFTPLQVKQTTTGYGKADKKQVQKMLQLTFEMKFPPQPDDAADALAIALTAAHHN